MQTEVEIEMTKSYFNSLSNALLEMALFENNVELNYKFYKISALSIPLQKDYKKIFCWNNYVYIVRTKSITLYSLITGSIKTEVDIDVENAYIYKKRLVIYYQDTIYIFNMTLTENSKKILKTPDGSKISCLAINSDVISCGTEDGQIIGWTVNGGSPLFSVSCETDSPILATLNIDNFFFAATNSEIIRWEYEIQENNVITVKDSSAYSYSNEPILQFTLVDEHFLAVTKDLIHEVDTKELKYLQIYHPKKISTKKIANLIAKNFWLELSLKPPNIVVGVVHRG